MAIGEISITRIAAPSVQVPRIAPNCRIGHHVAGDQRPVADGAGDRRPGDRRGDGRPGSTRAARRGSASRRRSSRKWIARWLAAGIVRTMICATSGPPESDSLMSNRASIVLGRQPDHPAGEHRHDRPPDAPHGRERHHADQDHADGGQPPAVDLDRREAVGQEHRRARPPPAGRARAAPRTRRPPRAGAATVAITLCSCVFFSRTTTAVVVPLASISVPRNSGCCVSRSLSAASADGVARRGPDRPADRHRVGLQVEVGDRSASPRSGPGCGPSPAGGRARAGRRRPPRSAAWRRATRPAARPRSARARPPRPAPRPGRSPRASAARGRRRPRRRSCRRRSVRAACW